MKLVFVSNYFNHHQAPLCAAFFSRLGDDFAFVETSEMTQERKAMGWGAESVPHYVSRASSEEKILAAQKRMVDEADVVIWGNAPDHWVRRRLKRGKLTFRYSERAYKTGCPAWQLPLRFVKNRWRFGFRNLHLLCASAYTAADYRLTGNFKGRAFRWGYFPACKTYDLDRLMAEKCSVRTKLLWAGRFLDWKHPEAAILLAEQLLQSGRDFELNMIGSGELLPKMQALVTEKNMDEHVHFLGSMPPEEVRRLMEQANIYLFTSDFNEGWGAVLNEAMNSGCAIAVSHAAGAAPYLIQQGINGMCYESGSQAALTRAVAALMDHPAECEKMGRAAYCTISELWNAETAADRLVQLIADLTEGKGSSYLDGPCSLAPILENDWFLENH